MDDHRICKLIKSKKTEQLGHKEREFNRKGSVRWRSERSQRVHMEEERTDSRALRDPNITTQQTTVSKTEINDHELFSFKKAQRPLLNRV